MFAEGLCKRQHKRPNNGMQVRNLCLSKKKSLRKSIAVQTHRAFKGLHVLPASFANIASMSKMSNIYFSTCEGQGEANIHAKTVYNKSGSCSAIFPSFALRVTYKCFRIRLQEFVACPAANSLTVTLHELYRVWSLSTLVQFSLAYPPTNVCLSLSCWVCAQQSRRRL